ncbi:hypothetical protein Nepgr_003710 [Nepenthes gracilis]|uniref:Cation-transporting P-type ATPase N-terminal domain-containing protein n=1 Tax=Nepenthes gracilis TaxID=150966 RepID=A0AAD3S006_NEPGR|nr:hypothetical protein Nepgr_003710 [Nepenthes gracilis]
MSQETTPVEEVFEQLQCFKEDLTKEEGQKRLEIFGQNKHEDKKDSKFLKFLGFMWNPLSWVMEATAIMTIALANAGGKPPDYPDVLRGRKWSEKEAAILGPEDVITIKLGDIVPADARLLKGNLLKIDQATLTGVSLPFTTNPGDETFSGPTCKQGKSAAVVMATGMYTFFGKAAHLVDSTWSLWPLLWFQKALWHSSQALHHQEQDFIEEEIPKATRILQRLTADLVTLDDTFISVDRNRSMWYPCSSRIRRSNYVERGILDELALKPVSVKPHVKGQKFVKVAVSRMSFCRSEMIRQIFVLLFHFD